MVVINFLNIHTVISWDILFAAIITALGTGVSWAGKWLIVRWASNQVMTYIMSWFSHQLTELERQYFKHHQLKHRGWHPHKCASCKVVPLD